MTLTTFNDPAAVHVTCCASYIECNTGFPGARPAEKGKA